MVGLLQIAGLLVTFFLYALYSFRVIAEWGDWLFVHKGLAEVCLKSCGLVRKKKCFSAKADGSHHHTHSEKRFDFILSLQYGLCSILTSPNVTLQDEHHPPVFPIRTLVDAPNSFLSVDTVWQEKVHQFGIATSWFMTTISRNYDGLWMFMVGL